MAAHDQRFKTMLREFFPDFLRLAVPDRADAFDCSTLTWLEQEQFLDPPTGRSVLLDLVARLEMTRPAAGESPGPWLAILNLEVEAEDRATDLRAKIYRYWHALRERHRLPVLSLALYLRVGLEGVGLDVYEEAMLGVPQLTFRFPYVGLPGLAAFDYLEGDNLLAVALAALMRCPAERRPELKAGALQRVATAPVNDAGRYLLAECIQAYLSLEAPQIQEYEYLLRTEPYREAATLTQNTFLEAVEAAEKRGRLEFLRRLLRNKFGPLQQSHLDRLEQRSIDELDALADAVLTATSLRELGLED